MSDLTSQEQSCVRTSLQFLRAKSGGWKPVSKALRIRVTSLSGIAGGHKTASASLAVRVARFANVTVDDVLTGRFPGPGTCPYCGHRAEVQP